MLPSIRQSYGSGTPPTPYEGTPAVALDDVPQSAVVRGHSTGSSNTSGVEEHYCSAWMKKRDVPTPTLSNASLSVDSQHTLNAVSRAG